MIQRWKQRGNHLATARLAVHRDLTWPARLLRYVLLLLLFGAGMYGGYRYGWSAHAQVASGGPSSGEGRNPAEEAQSLRQTLGSVEQQLRVELATRETLSRQIQQYQTDNSALRERLAFFESLLTRTDRAPGLAIDSFRAEALSPGHYRFKLVLIQGQSSREPFGGELDFKLTTERSGQRASLVWPERRLPIRVDRFGIVESDVDLPEGTRLRQVEVRLHTRDGRGVQLARSFDVKG